MFRRFVAVGLLSSFSIPAFAWADFLKNESRGMTASERAALQAMFPDELAAQPEVKQMVSECKSGKLANRICDCQLKAKTLDAFDDCSG